MIHDIKEAKAQEVMRDICKLKREMFLKHHVNTKGNKMTWMNYPYMMKIYKDTSPQVVVMSSVQTGKSEESLIHAFACLRMGLSVFHVFSTDIAKNAFIKSRVEDLCDKVPYYQEMERDVVRNKYLKAMGNAEWKFAISGTRRHFDEFPADVVIVDEYDSCNQDNVKLADGRMENSRYKFKRIIGNPSIKNFGVSEMYDKSNKKEWHFKCYGCGEFFPADFFKVVVKEILDEDNNHLRYELYDKEWAPDMKRDIYMCCPHCGCLQDRNKWNKDSRIVKYDGKWIAEAPDVTLWTGYHISQLMKLNSKISDLWRELIDAEGNDYKLQVFYNRLIGLPYEGTGSKITMELLDTCAIGYSEFKQGQSHGRAVAGIDVGKYYDMHIDLPIKEKKTGKKRKMFLHACRCESLTEVKDKLKQFNVGTLYIDAAPEYNAIQEFQEEMYGICDVWRVQITRARTGNLKLQGYRIDEEEGCMTVDRDWLLGEGMRSVKENIDLIPESYAQICNGFWAESLCSVTREYDPDDEQFHWSKAEGLDHFRFAHAFSFLAFLDSREPVLIDDLGVVIGIKPSQEATQEEQDRAKRKLERIQKMKNIQQEAGIIKTRVGIRRMREKANRYGNI